MEGSPSRTMVEDLSPSAFRNLTFYAAYYIAALTVETKSLFASDTCLFPHFLKLKVLYNSVNENTKPWGAELAELHDGRTVAELRRLPNDPDKILWATHIGAGRPGPGENVTALAPACRHAAGETLRRFGVSPAAPETGGVVRPGASLDITVGR
ncbi:hypothetical protein NDU88_004484 [Pleurodeles waltl]|uniref:Uncharacterized protein n=1 Tax=Pleurodeles waltl TaxID=8319 RepID=A0AAV7MXM2_PLEWA|nr:hypothetical protein NDU88_004484 [Pleurodeles waltl]